MVHNIIQLLHEAAVSIQDEGLIGEVADYYYIIHFPQSRPIIAWIIHVCWACASPLFPMKNFVKGVMLISSICHYGNKQNSHAFKKINQKNQQAKMRDFAKTTKKPIKVNNTEQITNIGLKKFPDLVSYKNQPHGSLFSGWWRRSKWLVKMYPSMGV